MLRVSTSRSSFSLQQITRVEATHEFSNRDTAQQRRAGHHAEHLDAKCLERRHNITLQALHIVRSDGIENHPAQPLSQLLTRGQQRVNAAAVFPEMDKNDRCIKVASQLHQTQAIEQALLEIAGRLQQSDTGF